MGSARRDLKGSWVMTDFDNAASVGSTASIDDDNEADPIFDFVRRTLSQLEELRSCSPKPTLVQGPR
jgi:hypothetical protein